MEILQQVFLHLQKSGLNLTIGDPYVTIKKQPSNFVEISIAVDFSVSDSNSIC